MKKLLLVLAACFMLHHVSAQTVDVTPIVGNYTCDFYLALGAPVGEDAVAVPGTPVAIKQGAAAGTIDFELNDFSLQGEVLGDVKLSAITINKDAEGKYTFAEHERQPVALSLGGDPINAMVKLDCQTSYIKDGKAYIDVDILWITDPDNSLPIYVRLISTEFVGTATPPVDVTPIVGDYTCDFYLALGAPVGEDAVAVPGTPVAIKQGAAAGTIDFELNDFSLQGEVLGDVKLSAITINKDAEGKYTFAEHERQPVALSLGGDPINAMVKLDCQTSYIKDGKAYIDVDILWITGPDNSLPIYVRLISTEFVAGISSVEAATVRTKGVYSLDGRYVGNALGNHLPKGVYIVNGKKVLH